MALPINALTAPLGQTPAPAEKPRRLPSAVPALIIGGLSAVLLTFGAIALIADDPLGGEPVARVATRAKAPVIAAAQPAAEPATMTTAQPAAPQRPTINIINGSTGQRQQFEIGAPIMAQRPAPARPEAAEGRTQIDISSNGEVRITPADGKQAAEIKRYMQSAQKPPATSSSAKVINLPQ